MNVKTLSRAIFLSLSLLGHVEASPFSRFTDDCHGLIARILGTDKRQFQGIDYQPPGDAHASHFKAIKEFEQQNLKLEDYPHLPYFNQSVKRFKNTDEAYLEYYMERNAWKRPGYQNFIENTAEILFFPNSSLHGHVRLRIGKMVYGFENIRRVFMQGFEPERIFKQERQLKRGKKAGNMGIVFVLTQEHKKILAEKLPEIEKFYGSSQKYNLPPFDGKGELEVKVLVDEQSGKISYHSPSPPSSYGNRGPVNATLEQVDGGKFLVAPNGVRQAVFENDRGELVSRSFSCTSSACHVMNNFLGLNVKDMPYAGSFMTHLKNGAEGYLKPDAIIHYFPEDDL